MFTLTGLLGLSRFIALAGVRRLTGLSISHRRLRLIAKLRGGFEPFADRLVGHLSLARNLLGVFADLSLRIGEAVLGVLQCLSRRLLSG